MPCLPPKEHHVYKDPDASKQFGFTWDRWLSGEIIVASTWAVTSYPDLDDMTLSNSGFDETSSWVRVAGGAVRPGGVDDDDWVYLVTNTITLSDGQIEQRSLFVHTKEM